MRKASPTVIAFLVFTFILAGSAVLFNRYDGLSFAQEGGIEQASKRAKELAAEAQGLVTEAENKLAVARVALQAARDRGDREAEQAILTAMSKLENDINSAREVADKVMDIAGKVEDSKTAAGAAAAVNSIKASVKAIETVSNSVSATVSLIVALGAGDMDAAQIADRLSGEADEAAQEALNLASNMLKAAEGALATSDEGKAARSSEQAKAAVQKSTEISNASKVASEQAEAATAQAAAALGMAPPPAGGVDVAKTIQQESQQQFQAESSFTGTQEAVVSPTD